MYTDRYVLNRIEWMSCSFPFGDCKTSQSHHGTSPGAPLGHLVVDVGL